MCVWVRVCIEVFEGIVCVCLFCVHTREKQLLRVQSIMVLLCIPSINDMSLTDSD